MLEIDVVFEEIAVSQDMGDDQLILDQGIAFQQKGVAGVGIYDHFVDAAQVVIILRLHLVIGLAESPVRETGGHTVSPKGIDNIRRADFKIHIIKVQTKFPGPGGDYFHGFRKLVHFFPVHERQPPAIPAPGNVFIYKKVYVRRWPELSFSSQKVLRGSNFFVKIKLRILYTSIQNAGVTHMLPYLVTWLEGEEVFWRFADEEELARILESEKHFIITRLELPA
jgi:hypothetical protein